VQPYILAIVGIDQIWLGVFVCILIEIELITPPVRLNLYVIKGEIQEDISMIVRGAVFFFDSDGILIDRSGRVSRSGYLVTESRD
jgi:TRAP-type C4-dicarboxylate transport system permease large subunit